MKIVYIFLIFLVFSSNIFSQDCQATSSQVDLDANNVSVRLTNGGDLWWDRTRAGYTFPKADNPLSEVKAIFAGGFWLSGFDPSGNLKVTAQNYSTAPGENAFFAGPISNNDLTDLETCVVWDQHFRVNDSDIMNFRIDISDGTIDDPIPFSIRGWPGKDNPLFFDIYGFDLPESMALAPFWDENADGIYNPNDGDYPLTKGADQAVWWIMNDKKGVSSFDPVGVVMQVMALSYADDNPALNNSTIYDVQITNIGFEELSSGTISLWIDPELGCFTDDYVGCLKEEDLAFIYNMDDEDGDNGCFCPAGVNTYCTNIPVMGIKLLKGPVGNDGIELGMSSFLTFNNAAFGGDPNQSEPTSAIGFANFMQGFWRDGTPMMENGELVRYQYSGNPADGEAYTMCSTNVTAPDKRMLLNFGNFDLPPGAVNEMSFAVTGLESVAHPCPDISELVELTNELKELYVEGIVSDVRVVNESEENHALKVFPNPMTHATTFKLEAKDGPNNLEILERISINSLDGRGLLNITDINDSEFNFENMDLPSGVYIYKAHVSSQKIYAGKLVVVKF